MFEISTQAFSFLFFSFILLFSQLRLPWGCSTGHSVPCTTAAQVAFFPCSDICDSSYKINYWNVEIMNSIEHWVIVLSLEKAQDPEKLTTGCHFVGIEKSLPWLSQWFYEPIAVVNNQGYCRHTEMSADKASGIAVCSVVKLIGQAWQRNTAYHRSAKKQGSKRKETQPRCGIRWRAPGDPL